MQVRWIGNTKWPMTVLALKSNISIYSNTLIHCLLNLSSIIIRVFWPSEEKTLYLLFLKTRSDHGTCFHFASDYLRWALAHWSRLGFWILLIFDFCSAWSSQSMFTDRGFQKCSMWLCILQKQFSVQCCLRDWGIKDHNVMERGWQNS